MKNESTIRILIVDDHPIVNDGLAAIMDYQTDMQVVGQAATGLEALTLFREHAPDITLMDLRMPEMDGAMAIAAIRLEYPSARIIVLTTYDGDEDIYKGLRAGAAGYLLKDTPTDIILESIRTVHNGKKVVPPDVAIKLADRVNRTNLSNREIEVLHFISQGKSNLAIANLLSIAEGTVKAHVTNIFNKLDADDRTHAVTIALKRGILQLD